MKLRLVSTVIAQTLVLFIVGTPIVRAAERLPLDSEDVKVFSGDPWSIGQQHGAAFASEINQVFATYVQPQFGSPEEWAWALNAARQYEARLSDALKQEISGVAVGARLNYDQVLVGNIIPELGQMLGRPVACSTFAVLPLRSATGGMLMGRNLDYGSPELLSPAVRPYVLARTGVKRILSVGIPGMVGVLTGINSSRVTLSQMYSFHSDQDERGIPTSMLYREVLEAAKDVAEAIQGLRLGETRATATNTMVTDGKDAAVVEMTAHRFAVRSPSQSQTIYSANHFESTEFIGASNPSRDWRWAILSRHDSTVEPLRFEHVRSTIADAGRNMGNVLSFFVDYRIDTVIFGHEGRPTAEGPLHEVSLQPLLNQ